ncbi:MAG TPA: hypothetical protein VLD62_07390 [Acidimicrobiia bacterium]|nr:hypothetical protein [Acidimicrobiia bacterium]
MATALRVPSPLPHPTPTVERPSLHVVPGAAEYGLVEPPGDWTSVENVLIGTDRVDRVIVGPNGVFAVVIDPEPGHLSAEGLIRDGDRVKEPVKRALRAAHELSRHMDGVFAYPVLLAGRGLEPGYLGRLRVVGVDRLPEALWCHPGRPMRRSERASLIASLRDASAPRGH